MTFGRDVQYWIAAAMSELHDIQDAYARARRELLDIRGLFDSRWKVGRCQAKSFTGLRSRPMYAGVQRHDLFELAHCRRDVANAVEFRLIDAFTKSGASGCINVRAKRSRGPLGPDPWHVVYLVKFQD